MKTDTTDWLNRFASVRRSRARYAVELRIRAKNLIKQAEYLEWLSEQKS